MKPTAITVSRFRGWKNEHRFALVAPITSIVAENSRGKSSLLNAIEWCLYGAVVTKKGSGIDERQDWELRTRGENDDTDPTVVTLELETAQGPTSITRKRSATAKMREVDEITILDASGTVLTGDRAESWLVESGLPDWETYRRAHCFHQEAARQRIVSTNERSAILATLLGLDDDLELRNAIESQQPNKIFTEIDKTLYELNEEAHRALDLPRRRLSELESQAETIGVDASQLSGSTAKTLTSQLVARGGGLATRLGLDAEMPDETDAVAVRRWATTWPATARSSSPALAALEGHRRRLAQLDELISNYEQVDGTWQTAQSNLQQERQTGGDEAQRGENVAEAKAKLTEAAFALKQNDAKAQLLIDAKAAIVLAIQNNECPVCETNVPGLPERLDAAIETLRSDEFEALQTSHKAASAALDKATSARDTLKDLVRVEEKAGGKVDGERNKLRHALENDESTLIHDLLAEAKKQRELTQTEITNLESLAADRDQGIDDHQADWDRLDLIEKWLAATEKAESSIDLSNSPEWTELNEGLDELAGFGSDLAFLGNLAREVQAERSRTRVDEVNKELGRYYSLITQDDTEIHASVRTTAQRISYDLVDASGRPAVPILNQAAINALSLAILFAQSEAQSSSGGWQLVTLDDPVQSLDSEKQAGLARAIEDISEHCHVLVATIPGHFSDRLHDYVSKQRHIVTLAPWSQTDGASVEDEVDR